MKNILSPSSLIAALIWLPVACMSQSASNGKLEKVFQDFTQEYETYTIPNLQLSYKANLENIPDLAEIQKQEVFFKKYKTILKKIKLKNLSPRERLAYEHLNYEVQLNLERLSLSQKFREEYPNPHLDDRGLYYQSMGQEWYKYYLKKWLSVDISPQELMDFGYEEIRKVQSKVREIQKELGYAQDSIGFYKHLQADAFFLRTEEEVQQRYQEMDVQVREKLSLAFHQTTSPEVTIQPIPNVTKDSPPGYYNPGTKIFSYSFYQQRHNTRGMKFLYLHEAIPGHHYQIQIARELENRPAFAQYFSYGAYVEGWAAYIEELAEELKLYDNSYELLGRLEWDLVRSTRVVMDVGLNHLGWSKEKALAFWKSQIAGQDDIAMREIDRMLRWPVQIHTYKVGAETIKQLRKQAKNRMQEAFNLKDFHRALLNTGAVPLAILEKYLALDL